MEIIKIEFVQELSVYNYNPWTNLISGFICKSGQMIKLDFMRSEPENKENKLFEYI